MENFSHMEKIICGWENYFDESFGEGSMMKKKLMVP